MEFTTFLPLISSLFVFSLGVLVLYKNIRSRLNVTFFLHALSITGWLFATFMMFYYRGDTESVIFWDRMVYSFVVFIPAFMYHFCLALINKKRNFFLYLAYTLSIIFLILSRTDYFVKDIFIYKWGTHTKAQLFHHLFLLYFSSYVVAWFFIVYRYYKSVESSTLRYQIKYFFIAFLVLFGIGPLAYLPAYGIGIYPFSYISGVIFSIILSYAIIRHRLMDIRVVFRRGSVYILSFIIIALVYFSFKYILDRLFSLSNVVSDVLILFFCLVIFNTVRDFFYFIANKYFFSSLYNYQQTITKLTHELNSYNDLGKLVNLIVDTIIDTMKLNRAGVLLVDSKGREIHYKIAKVIGFNVNNGISLVKDDFLTRYLEKSRKLLVRDELTALAKDSSSQSEKRNFLNLFEQMKHIEASLCLPLISSKNLIGIIVLGSKDSGDAYTKEDLELLSILSYQASIAIDNARLYKEANDFNKTLEQKVEEQTKDLRDKAEHLEKLLKMRTEFLDIASHQLKTPISVIRGTISMFEEGSMDKVTEVERKKFFHNIAIKADKLNSIISDILRASEMDTDEFKIDDKTSKLEQIEDIVHSVDDQLRGQTNAKNIQLIVESPKKKLPKIMTSGEFLEQAIYNLVDNAIKYTQKGFVKISLSEEDGNIIVKVQDSGIGIPIKDQKKVFDKFARGTNAVNMYADGSGLGLFIVKKIVEAHKGGQVSVQSEENKGTTFTVSLPGVSGNNKPKSISKNVKAAKKISVKV